jgi:hypothetical protein
LTFDHTDSGYDMGDGIGSQTHEHATDLSIREGADRDVAEPVAWKAQKSRQVHTVKLQLPFEWRQRRDETMWEYAIRRQDIVCEIRKRQ